MVKPDSFFTDKVQFRTIDTFRVVYLISSIIWFIITELGRFVYRPVIYKNDLKDFGIADSIGNSGGIIVQIFFCMALLNPPRNTGIRLILFLTCGYILYEIVQPYLPKGTFDWKDIIGTLAGGFFGYIYFQIIHTVIKKNRIYYRF